MRRLQLRLAATFALVAAATAGSASCSFPKFDILPDTSGAGGSSSATSSTSSTEETSTTSASTAGGAITASGSTGSTSSSGTSSSGSTGSTGSTGTSSSGSTGSSTSGSASSGTGGGMPCKTECDCDGDGAIAWDCPKGKGPDCADYDPRARPGMDFLTDSAPIAGPRKPGTQDYDFNCDTKEEREFVTSAGCKADLLSCNGSGFTNDTACGMKGTYNTCGPTGLTSCGVKATDVRAQGCN